MKKILIALFTLALVLSGCSGSKVFKNGYSYVFATDLRNMDYTMTYRQSDHIHNANFVDGLQENDPLGSYVADLATKVSHNADYSVWTYTLRKGVNWVTSTGEVYAEVKAQDFITALQHAADFNSNMLYIVAGSIKNLDKYVNGEITDFTQVGIKATDDYTLEYTLNGPESYWNSKTAYSILYPINKEFLETKGAGCKLGSPVPSTCTFGKPQPDSILYNGPYILTNFTSKSVIEYTANANYWDKKNVFIPTVKLVYYDGTDPDSLLRAFTAGTYSAARIYTTNQASYEAAKVTYKDNIYTSLTGGSTFNMTFNIARTAYVLTKKTTDKQKTDTAKAILNKNFRLAIMFGFDRVTYLAQAVGSDLAKVGLRNALTPPTFVNVNGKNYGEAVSAELTKLDATTFPAGFNLTDGQDPYYNPTIAAAFMAKAVTELTAQGVSFPIVLDIPEDSTNTVGINQGQSLKNSIEKSLGANNVVIAVNITDEDTYLNATYYAGSGEDSDFDISTASGWGPDYVDPKSYLDIYDPVNGDMLSSTGLNPVSNATPTMIANTKAVGLDAYQALIDTADKQTTDVNARYALYAKADAWLIANAYTIPINADGGTPTVSKVVPFTAPYSWAGIASYKFKYMQVSDKIVTVADRDAAFAAWTKKRAALTTK